MKTSVNTFVKASVNKCSVIVANLPSNYWWWTCFTVKEQVTVLSKHETCTDYSGLQAISVCFKRNINIRRSALRDKEKRATKS